MLLLRHPRMCRSVSKVHSLLLSSLSLSIVHTCLHSCTESMCYRSAIGLPPLPFVNERVVTRGSAPVESMSGEVSFKVFEYSLCVEEYVIICFEHE